MASRKEKDSLEAEATRWHIRRTAPEFTAQDEDAFQSWVNVDPAHAVAYAKVSHAWDLTACLGEHAEAEPGPFEAVFNRRVAAAAMVGAMATGAGWWLVRPRPERISTAVGEQRRLTLADGSKLILNTNSAVEIAFGRHWRNVTLLRGEAAFDVAKDPGRMFRVLASGSQIVALGTSFGVRITGAEARLLMTEGLVRVSNATGQGPKTYVPSGNEALISHQAIRVMKIAPAELERLLSWEQGVLEFNSQTVEQIADEFNRYNRSKIVVVDPKAAKLRFGGRFGIADSRRFVTALCSSFPVKAIYGQDGNIYLMAADKSDI